MPLRNKGGRMLKVALKESTLDVVDREMPEKSDNIYAPCKQKDESLASLLSDEDMYSDYDDKGNKIKVYNNKPSHESSSSFNIICIISLLLVITGLVWFLIYAI